MIIGCPKEIKPQEHRAGLVPSSVKEMVVHGHEVLIEKKCGIGINYTDEEYIEAGAKICDTADEIFETAEMIIKVKEPQKSEYSKLREDQLLFTYLHLAPDPELARGLMDSGCVAIAYETVTGHNGKGLPLLAPMSEVAGRLSTLVGSYHLQKHLGGTGRLAAGVPGVLPAQVLIIGGGVAGFNAARVAIGMGADVIILERDHERMRFLDNYFKASARVLYSYVGILERFAATADLIIGAVLIPGAAAPRLVTKNMLSEMIKGAVMVDIAIDQGGCFETSKPTTHDNPVYVVDDVVHYCVANMPGAVPLSSTLALNHAVLPYALELADKGWVKAVKDNQGLYDGLNVFHGKITHPIVADALGVPFVQV